MSFASRMGYDCRDPKLKVPEIPVKAARVVKDPGCSHGPDLAIVARLQAELKVAYARIAELEAQLAAALVTQTVTPVTPSVMPDHNAPITPRNAAAERQRAYRERQKAKKAAQA